MNVNDSIFNEYIIPGSRGWTSKMIILKTNLTVRDPFPTSMILAGSIPGMQIQSVDDSVKREIAVQQSGRKTI